MGFYIVRFLKTSLSFILILVSVTTSALPRKSRFGAPLTPTNILKRSVTMVPGDFSKITQWPFYHYKKTLYSTLLVAGLMSIDKYSTEFVQDTFNRWFDFSLPAVISAKNISAPEQYLVLGMVGMYAFSWLTHNTRGQVAPLLAAKSAIYSVIYTQLILKTVIGRYRPDPDLGRGNVLPGYSNNPWGFRGLHKPQLGGDTVSSSMPSFHFTFYFAIATTLRDVYHSWVPYAIVLCGLIPDFKSHHHWVSDMVAGGLIGTLIGNTVYDNYMDGLKERIIGLPGSGAKIVFEPIITAHGGVMNVSVDL